MADTHDDELAALRAENERLRGELTALAQAEERFRVLFEHSWDALLIFDSTGIIDCNSAALRMLRCDDRSQLRSCTPPSSPPSASPTVGSRARSRSRWTPPPACAARIASSGCTSAWTASCSRSRSRSPP
ncbi:PAS domain-containing protein [Nannocystis pusilla]|uniref:PAS domain-containing protein n=1 Tax=Nannocystis pusilla TaxID=889268 RepID=UPI003B7C2C7C